MSSQADLNNMRCISARFGAEGCAPNFVADWADAALANRIASSKVFPSAMATDREPLKTSPAAVLNFLRLQFS